MKPMPSVFSLMLKLIANTGTLSQKKHPRTSPGQGNVTIGQYSGLRKLMRAARRGKIPPERLFTIETAEAAAKARTNG